MQARFAQLNPQWGDDPRRILTESANRAAFSQRLCQRGREGDVDAEGRRERGQILPIVALALVVMLGISAFAIDVGYAYYAKRQLQSATDAAALAGAQDLPSIATAKATAATYAAANVPANLSRPRSRTRPPAPRPQPRVSARRRRNPNNLTVTGTASTNTWFAKIFGIGEVRRHRQGQRLQPVLVDPRRRRRRARPHRVDVPRRPDRDGDCTDLDNAKDGVHTLLSILNPPYAQVGMIAFPPLDGATHGRAATRRRARAATTRPTTARIARYLTDQIGSDYKTLEPDA